MISAFGPDKLTLVGYGRSDSPGYSAKYGTYSLMESDTGAILTFVVKHVSQSGSSPAMEMK